MTNKTVELIANLEATETDFYAKLVPPLLKEISETRKLLKASELEHSKTKETLDKIYKDYEASRNGQYRLTKSVMLWKLISVCSVAFLITTLIFGVVE